MRRTYGSGEVAMAKGSWWSRREFVGTAISTAAVGALPIHSLLGSPMGAFAGGSTANWKDEGVLNLDNSPYAKLHSVPVHAVTITQGFWGARREINVNSSIPSIE